ncbi:MAG: DJ-1/PfpI family protein [Planctomycetota bacterium]|nr:DJ-1/PfpI family protein [Planctomycetota bacterium]
MKLKGKKIAILAGKIYEDTELWYPYFRLKEEGATVELVGTSDSPDVVESKHGYPARIDCRANIASADDFHRRGNPRRLFAGSPAPLQADS